MLCDPGTVNFTATGAPQNQANIYNLNPGNLFSNSDAGGNGAFNAVSVSNTTTFTLSVTYGGCTKTASQAITVYSSIIVSIDPVNPQICSGTTTLTAYVMVNGSDQSATSTYLWSNSATTQAINVGPGTYTVTATTSVGCTGDNIPTSTVSLASAGGGSNCNVYYVNSVSGAGDCLTKSTPGSLTTALGLAVCNNGIIQMQTGIYTFTDKVNVGSYVTIEGGFNSTFTIKTSNMASGSATTIQRSNTADSDDPTSCSAFKIVAGATAFRFQDIRIELPGSPNVTALTNGSGISNYGIKMGAGCTSYNIIRCYIDAGKGANP